MQQNVWSLSYLNSTHLLQCETPGRRSGILIGQQTQLHSGPQGWQLAGLLRLQALDVSVRLSTLRPLGSYQLDVQGGERTRLALTTLNGRLQLSGQGHWQGQGLVFSGEASAEPEHEAALNNLLNLMGQRQGSRSSFKIG